MFRKTISKSKLRLIVAACIVSKNFKVTKHSKSKYTLSSTLWNDEINLDFNKNIVISRRLHALLFNQRFYFPTGSETELTTKILAGYEKCNNPVYLTGAVVDTELLDWLDLGFCSAWEMIRFRASLLNFSAKLLIYIKTSENC